MAVRRRRQPLQGFERHSETRRNSVTTIFTRACRHAPSTRAEFTALVAARKGQFRPPLPSRFVTRGMGSDLFVLGTPSHVSTLPEVSRRPDSVVVLVVAIARLPLLGKASCLVTLVN